MRRSRQHAHGPQQSSSARGDSPVVANKLDHLTVINRRLGLLTPQIVTPEMLWLEEAT